tara:strand:- start:42 stop:407 length:366 start_codon:yes stop_codon:yes gene_type:complete
MRTQIKHQRERRRRWRIRKKLKGTASRPRMSVRFTGRNIYVQFVDDAAGQTLASASTVHKAQEGREKLAANKASAEIVGKAAVEAAKAKGIEQVIFDRSGAQYHGKVAVLADTVRAGGIKF